MPPRLCIRCAAILLLAGPAAAADPLVTFRGHTDPVYAVAVSPDGRTAATASFDRTVRLWDVTNGTPLRTLTGHQGLVLSVTFAPDGKTLASGGADNTAKVWELTPTAPVRELAAGGPATATALSADGKTLAVGRVDGKVRVLSAIDGNQTLELAGHTGPVVGVGFLPAGFVTVADKTIRFWTAKGEPLVTGDLAAAPLGLLVPANGAFVAVTHTGGTLTLWPANPPKDKKLVPTKTVTEPSAVGPAAAMIGNQILTASATAALWNPTNGNKDRVLETTGPLTAVATHRNGQLIAVAREAVHLFAADGRMFASFKPDGKIVEMQFHPTAPLLIARLASGLAGPLAGSVVRVWNVAATAGQPTPSEFGQTIQAFPQSEKTAALTLSSDGKEMFAAGSDGNVRVWKLPADQPLKSFAHPNLVDGVAFSPDGKMMATACHDGSVRLFDPDKGTAPAKEIKAHVTPTPNPVYAVAFSPDGKTVASASYDQSVKLWDVATGNLVRELKPGNDGLTLSAQAGALIGAAGSKIDVPPSRGHRDQVFAVAFSKDGTRLATCGSDRTVKLWDVTTGQVVKEFVNPNLKPVLGDPPPSHPGFVHSVRFSGDGKTLISAGTAPRNSGFVAVWNVSDGKLLSAVELPLGPVYAIEPFGDRLLIGCGPKDRNRPESEAHVLRTPGK